MPLPEKFTNYQKELSTAWRAADASRAVLLNHFGHLSQVEEKHQAGLVSEADRQSEDLVVQEIRADFPEHSILGEESGLNSSSSSDEIWFIDPLDGTTNYVHRFPIFCSSIGLQVAGEMVVAIVDVPALDHRYYAVRGEGAWCNEQRLRVSERASKKEWLVGTGFSVDSDQQVDTQLELMRHFVQNSRGVRRAGAAAYDLCLVAAGVFDGFWEMSLKPWDTAAGTLLVEEAGGIVTNFKGEKYQPTMKDIVSGSSSSHVELLDVIRHHQN